MWAGPLTAPGSWPYTSRQMGAKAVVCEVYRTAIPMRAFEHAAAARDVAEAVVVRLQFDDGGEGWGETLPRQYVTGETIDSVVRDISETLWPACAALALSRLEEAESLPRRAPDGRCINAAACAMEVPIVRRLLADAGAAPGAIHARVSGVLGSADPARTARRLKLMRLAGLRDFKLKLGFGDDVDAENLRVVHERIGKAVARGRHMLRVDVNGAWAADETPRRVAALAPFGVCVVEQPVRCSAFELAQLARRCELPLMADESLLTGDDAEALVPAGQRIWWNIRISKNGGILRAKALAELAARSGVPFTIGCMVGETSILSAAQRTLLGLCPLPRFVEGNYGRFLLADDLASPSLRFGYGGRLKALPAGSPKVSPRKLARYGRLIATLRA